MGYPLNHSEECVCVCVCVGGGGGGGGEGGFLLPVLLFRSHLFYLYRTALAAVTRCFDQLICTRFLMYFLVR